MRMPSISRRLRLAACCLVLLGLAGCTDKTYNRYIPSDDKARQALEAALSAWQSGRALDRIEATPAVQAVDWRWRAGQQLQSYQILQEEPGEGPKVFSVRLVLQKPTSQRVVRYTIVGRDPIWVYNEDDYKAPAGM